MKLCKLVVIAVLEASLAIIIGLSKPIEALGLSDVLPWFKEDLKSLSHLADFSNDEAAHLSTHGLIERAGFEYENYYSFADDGYITQLIRIVNPLADKAHLKRPPIIIQHGQTANSKNFVMQSNKQHHPMRWPPNAEEKPQQASSNRSLAFMLANNGYDVWLSSTRGADGNNNGYIPVAHSMPAGSPMGASNKNMTAGEEDLLRKRTRNRGYWSFTLDDQIAHEMPSQVLTVLNVTGAPKVSLFGYSNTALTSFAMLSIRPDIAAHIDTYIAAAPVVYYNKLDGWFKWFMADFMQMIPASIDAQLFINDQAASFIRKTLIRTCKNLTVRYTFCKFALDLMFGESGQFRTNLELPFFGHLIRPTSWKCLAQHLQIVKRHKVAKFDYGARKNQRFYNSKEPPEYDLSNVNRNVHIVLVSGTKDNWANPATLDEVRRKLPFKPDLDLVVPDYNHLDLAAAFDVDVRVNLPLLKFLNERDAALMKIPIWEHSELGGDDSSDQNELGTSAHNVDQDEGHQHHDELADHNDGRKYHHNHLDQDDREEHSTETDEQRFNPLDDVLKILPPIKSLDPFSGLTEHFAGNAGNPFHSDASNFTSQSRALDRYFGPNEDLPIR